jgi:hypothetical protein
MVGRLRQQFTPLNHDRRGFYRRGSVLAALAFRNNTARVSTLAQSDLHCHNAR